MDRLEKALEETPLEMIMPGWRSKPDFGCPGCNGNLLASPTAPCATSTSRPSPSTATAGSTTSSSGATATHFGEEVSGRGGRYLYQGIPGVRPPPSAAPSSGGTPSPTPWPPPGSRSTTGLVIDVGCNAAMMSN